MQLQSSISPGRLSLEERLLLLAGVEAPGKIRQAVSSDKALSYARVSTSVQTSIPDQLECNLRNAARHALVVAHELRDTQSGLVANRAGYQELLRLAATGEYGHVLVFKADRLSRDDAEFVTTVRALLRLGMHIWDYTIGEIEDRNVGFLAVMAYAESRNIADRTQMKIEARAASGVKLGSPRVGYIHGDGPGTYVPDPVVGPVVTELFERCDGGESLGSLRRWFNGTLGKTWTSWDIKKLLRCEYYKGLNVNCKTRSSKLDGHYARPREEWVVTHHAAPLIDPDTWARVQARVSRQENVGQHRARPAHYALSGLLWCGRCSRRMHGRKMRETSKGYVCGACGASKGLLKTERAVRALLASLPVTAEQVAAEIGADVAADREQLAADLAALDTSLSKLSKRRTTLTILRGDGEMTAEDYRAAIAESDRERGALEQQREEIQQRLRALPQDTVLVDEALALLRALPSLVDVAVDASIEEQQQMYRACIKRVVLEAGAKTLTVEWLDHIARHMGAAQHTVQV